MKTTFCVHFLAATILCVAAPAAGANEIAEWNQIMLQASIEPPATNPIILTRIGAIVQASMFDAVNGIERRYTHIYVPPNAPPGASKRAAAVQASYANLIRLYPGQAATFALRRGISLANIASGEAAEHSRSIDQGIAWGQAVADQIWTWRLTDGFTTPPTTFPGVVDIGKWRPTPPANAQGFGFQFQFMTPWVINSPDQFRPAGPPALTSAKYATEFNETKTIGSFSSAIRTADQTLYSLFWNSATVNYLWDRVATSLAAEHHLTFSETNRLLALVNIAMADAAIGCWEAKYEYIFWRPITAIVEAAVDGNAATDPDAAWMPLFATPAHPDYPSGHSCASGAAARVLTAYFGDDTSFNVTSNGMPGVTRSFTTFSAALEEVKNARIYAGIHFRAACEDGQTLGVNVADYIAEHALLSLHGERKGQLRK